MKNSILVSLIGLYFAAQLFFNDMTNYLSIRYVVNIRPDRVLLVLLLLSFLKYYRKANQRIRIDRVEKAMILFVLIVFLSSIVSGSIHDPVHRNISTIFNFAVLPVLMFMLCRRIVFDREAVRRFFFMLTMIGLYLALTGVLEHYKVSALVYPSYIMDPGKGINFGRARGPFLNPAVLGSVLSILFLVGIAYVDNFSFKPAYWVVLGLMLSTIYFSYTRSAWLQIAVSLGMIFVFEPRMRKLFCAMGIVFIVVFVLGVLGKFSLESGTLFSRREGPIQDRVNIMNAGLNMFKEKPLTGFGYGTFGQYAYTKRFFRKVEGVPLRGEGEGNHNAILGLLAEVGLMGTIPYFVIFYYFLRVSLSLVRRSKRSPLLEKNIGIMNLAMVTGYFISIQFYDPRFFALLNSLVFAISGVTFSILEHRVNEGVSGRKNLV